MAKINEGDVMEGLFAITIAVLLSEGKVEKSAVNRIRSSIEPKLFATGRFEYAVAKNKKVKKSNNPADIFDVNLVIRLKEASVTGAYGKEYTMKYSKSSDIGNIGKKLDTLIESASPEKSSYARKLFQARDQFLDNNKGESVKFTVMADGIAGESSGGAVKGDVMVEIEAETSKGRSKIFSQSIPFSLKSESVTVANLSPYNGMLSIAKAFGLKWKDVNKYDFLKQKALSAAEKKKRFELIQKMYDELKKMIVQNKSNINDRAFNFLQDAIFGKDLADVVDMQKGVVKEITYEYFSKLKKSTKLTVASEGKNIVFRDSKTNMPIFQLRVKLRPPPANEAKFYLEVGKGIYRK
jgi:hypothetical protein